MKVGLKPCPKPFWAAAILTCIVCMTSVDAYADGPIENADLNQTRPRRVMPPPELPELQETTIENSPGDRPVIAYALYRDSLDLSETAPEPVQPTTVSFNITSLPSSATMLTTTVPRAPVASTAPLSAGEKFGMWFKGSFLSPGAYFGAVFKGMWSELQDDDDFKEDTVGNYFADSLTRGARSFAFSVHSGFLEDALFPTIFKQDPRYHRSDKKGFAPRVGYAISRVFVTQGDRCACNQFNASFLLGGAVSSVVQDFFERSERTGPVHKLTRWGNHILFTAGANILRELVGGQ